MDVKALYITADRRYRYKTLQLMDTTADRRFTATGHYSLLIPLVLIDTTRRWTI